jgi:predicted metalloprotease with PDZ domain
MSSRLKNSLILLAAVLLVCAAGGAVAAHDDDDDDNGDVLFYSVAAGDHSRTFLGVSVTEETEHPEGGALIENVVDDSPAEAAGLLEGDIIIGFNGNSVRGPRSLTEKIHDSEPGDSASIEIIRGGSRQTLTTELGERPGLMAFGVAGAPRALRFESGEWHEQMEGLEGSLKDLRFTVPSMRPYSLFSRSSRPKLGVQLVEATPELREFLGGTEDAGVLVGKVMNNMPAESAGIEVGDLIIALDGDDIANSGDLIAALADKDGQTVRIDVVRDKRVQTVQVAIPEPEDDDVGGPRAHRFGTDQFREAQRAVAAAIRLGQDEVRQATQEAARAYREALREAQRESREQWRDAREEAHDALREARALASRDSV